MDKVTEIYNLILHSNTLNFAIFLAIIILICKKFDIPSMLENMCIKIKQTIDDSSKAKKDAEKEKDQAIKSVENTENEISNINSAAKDKIKVLKEEVENDTELKIKNIQKNAQKIIDSEKKALTSNLISNIGMKSVETAKAQILKQISENKELHNKFIEDSIEELDKAVLNDIH